MPQAVSVPTSRKHIATSVYYALVAILRADGYSTDSSAQIAQEGVALALIQQDRELASFEEFLSYVRFRVSMLLSHGADEDKKFRGDRRSAKLQQASDRFFVEIADNGRSECSLLDVDLSSYSRSLSDKVKWILVARYFRRLMWKEIAELLAEPIRSLKREVAAEIEMLRKQCSNDGIDNNCHTSGLWPLLQAIFGKLIDNDVGRDVDRQGE